MYGEKCFLKVEMFLLKIYDVEFIVAGIIEISLQMKYIFKKLSFRATYTLILAGKANEISLSRCRKLAHARETLLSNSRAMSARRILCCRCLTDGRR